MDRLWRSNYSISSRTDCPLSIVNDEDHNVEKHGASAFMCLHDAKSKNFKDNIFCMADVSLNDHVYFNYYSEASSPYSKTASKEEGDGKSVDSNFDYVKQLKVLTILKLLVLIAKLLVTKKMVVNLLILTFLSLIILIMLSN